MEEKESQCAHNVLSSTDDEEEAKYCVGDSDTGVFILHSIKLIVTYITIPNFVSTFSNGCNASPFLLT